MANRRSIPGSSSSQIDLVQFKLMDVKSRKDLIRGMSLKNMQKLCRQLGIRDDGHQVSVFDRLAHHHF